MELHDEPPPVDEGWDEIVEVSFRPIGDTALVGWGGEGCWPLDLVETDYRVRYCGTRLDEGRTRDIRMDGDPEIDRYLLQFWPSRPEPDMVVRQTSAIADYWHRFARQQPPPPTREEQAEAERLARLEREQADDEARLKWDERARPNWRTSTG